MRYLHKQKILKKLLYAVYALCIFGSFGFSTVLASVPPAGGSTSSDPSCIVNGNCSTQPAGTCFAHLQGAGYQIKKCTVFGLKNGSKVNGLKLDFTKNCYAYTASQSSSNVSQVKCNNTPISNKPPVQICDDNGVSAPCQFCPDGSFAPNNDSNQCGGTDLNGTDCPSVNKCTLIDKYINPLVKVLAGIVGLGVTVSIVIGGIQYTSSAGDPAKVTAAKTRIRDSLIALLAFIFLYAMLNFLIPGGLL